MRHPTARGFTLVELMVVVAIIVALLAILMPSMGRAVYVANVALCASQFHQATMANQAYAADHYGLFPRHDITWRSVGRNTWDMHINTARVLHRYGYTYKTWHCPVRNGPPPTHDTVENMLDTMRWSTGEDWVIFRQSFWVPRRDSGNWIPSVGSDGLTPPEAFPTSTRHARLGVAPMISDTANASPAVPNPTDPATVLSGHQWNGRFESTNVGYGDGHVETHYVGRDAKYIFPHHVNWY